MKVSLMEAITLREDLDWGTAAKPHAAAELHRRRLGRGILLEILTLTVFSGSGPPHSPT